MADGPVKILSSDKLNSGWRTKHNQNVDQLSVSGTDLGDGTFKITKFGGTYFIISLLTSFFTKAQVTDKFKNSIGNIVYSESGNNFAIAIPAKCKITFLDVINSDQSNAAYKIGTSNDGSEIMPEIVIAGYGDVHNYMLNIGVVNESYHPKTVYIKCTTGNVKLVYHLIEDFYK